MQSKTQQPVLIPVEKTLPRVMISDTNNIYLVHDISGNEATATCIHSSGANAVRLGDYHTRYNASVLKDYTGKLILSND